MLMAWFQSSAPHKRMDFGSGVSSANVRGGDLWEISILFSKFYCEHITSVKIKSILKNGFMCSYTIIQEQIQNMQCNI
jgi:hypothetical protein